MDFNLNWIYTAISWVMLRWHDVLAATLPQGTWLGTNWDWVLSVVFLVITIRIILFPLFMKQIKSQRAMQVLQPKMKELQERYKGDRETLQREMMELYRTEKANPLMGCLPLLLQAPVFIGLLHVLRRIRPDNTLESNQYLYTWNPDYWFSAMDAKVFGAPFWGTFQTPASHLEGVSSTHVKIVCGVLVIIMTATTYLSSRQMIMKQGPAADPQQRMIQNLMLYGIPFMILFSGFIFPIGVILYWVVNNAFSLGQQQWVLYKYPPPKPAGADTQISAKPGTKKYDEQLREKQERAKSTAPKPGAKPVRKQEKSSAAQQLKQKQQEAKTKASQAPGPGAKPSSKKKKGGATRGANK